MEQAQTGTKRVLCIEDERFINELYERALNKAGYDVKIVTDGKEGLQELYTDNYDIVLLDIMLPEMLGTEILKKVRHDKPNLRARIIVATNLEFSEEHRAAVESQADGYIIKAEMTPKQMVSFLQQLD